jgi:pimeloyl-ACP methyl ester carboxylesterase
VTRGRQIWKHVRRIWIAAGITATAVFVIWSLIAYRPNSEARQASIGDGAVAVTYTEGVWELRAATRKARQTALVFFPGALVDPRAYAPLVRAVAAAGYPAFIVELPRRGAFGGADAPEVHVRFQAALRQLSGSAKVVLGGHSRGAVVASGLASRRLPGLAGLILIGTSHPRDVDLSELRVPVVKIAGTHDGLATTEEVKQNASKLPAGTRWVWVEGGNHSQFGWYGFQPGDWRATIDASTQRRLMIEAVLALLGDAETAGPSPDTAVGGPRR